MGKAGVVEQPLQNGAHGAARRVERMGVSSILPHDTGHVDPTPAGLANRIFAARLVVGNDPIHLGAFIDGRVQGQGHDPGHTKRVWCEHR